MEPDVKIFMDHREDGTPLAKMLAKKCEVEIKSLKIADFLLSSDVACERKTANDFVQSIIDGRLFKQASEIKSCFESPFFIIEGDVRAVERNMHPNAIRGAIASISLDFKIPVIHTHGFADTAEFLFQIAKREQLDLKKPVVLRGKKKCKTQKQEIEFLVTGLPGISTLNAHRLLNYFKNSRGIFTADEKELQKVEGIGKIKAKRIRELMEAEWKM